MTKPDLYKAIWQIKAIDGGNLNQVHMIRKVMNYLHDNGLIQHFVKIYDNDNELVVVLTDRDTALLLKLAMA